jgi:glutamine synthetase
MTPHSSNYRAELRKHEAAFDPAKYWWGFEQEYFITKDFVPLGFPKGGYPKPQGLYYCGVGGNQVRGRKLVEKHLLKCLEMGIQLTGTNAEVAVGQWEFQCFGDDTLKACDDLWVSRYVLYRLAEEYKAYVNLSPKPVHGDWNGSGCHTNFSNENMRTKGGKEYFEKIFASFAERHDHHIINYGENNELRLTGLHETQHIGTFSWGVGDRGASIRVPNAVEKDGWVGYLEDRRPASNCDPYRVATVIVEAIEA